MRPWEILHECYFGSGLQKSIDIQLTTLAEYRRKLCNNLSWCKKAPIHDKYPFMIKTGEGKKFPPPKKGIYDIYEKPILSLYLMLSWRFFPLRLETEPGCMISTFFQHCSGSPSQCFKTWDRNKQHLR